MYKFLNQGHYAGIPARNLSDAEWERFTANLSTRETALVVTLYEFQPGELPKRVVKRVKPESPTDPVEVVEPEPTEPEAPAPSPEPEPTPEPTPPEPDQPTANTANKKGGK